MADLDVLKLAEHMLLLMMIVRDRKQNFHNICNIMGLSYTTY